MTDLQTASNARLFSEDDQGMSIEKGDVMKILYWRIRYMLFCAFFLPGSAASGRDIVVLYALESDAREVIRAAPVPAIIATLRERRLSTVKIGVHTVHLMRMGAGPVESAVSTERLLGAVNADLVVSIGPAGQLNPAVAPVGTWLEITSQTPYQRTAPDADAPTGADLAADTWPSARGLLRTAPGAWTNLPTAAAASGESFVASADVRDRLARVTRCDVVEMNLFGVRQALRDRKPDQVHLRIVSDRADERAVEDFRAFLSGYDGEGGRRLAAWIRSLPEDPRRPEAHGGLRGLLGR